MQCTAIWRIYLGTGNPCCSMSCSGSWPCVYKGTHFHSIPQSSESCSAVSISREMSKESGIVQQPFKHYLVLDFESTCQEGARIDPQEIIEFPCLLVRAEDLSLVDQVAMTYLASIPRCLDSIQNLYTICSMFFQCRFSSMSMWSLLGSPSWQSSALISLGSLRVWYRY